MPSTLRTAGIDVRINANSGADNIVANDGGPCATLTAAPSVPTTLPTTHATATARPVCTARLASSPLPTARAHTTEATDPSSPRNNAATPGTIN